MIASNALAGLLPAATSATAGSTASDAPAGSDGLFASLLGAVAPALPAEAGSVLPLLPAAEPVALEALPDGELELPADPLALLVWLPWMQSGGEPASANAADGQPTRPAGLSLTLTAAPLPAPTTPDAPAAVLTALAGEAAVAVPAAAPLPVAAPPVAALAVAAEAAVFTASPQPIPLPTRPVARLAAADASSSTTLPTTAALPDPTRLDAQAGFAALRGDLMQATRHTLNGERQLAGAGIELLDARSEPLLGATRNVDSSAPKPSFTLSLPAMAGQRASAELGEAIESRLQWMAERGVSRAQIRLSPAELGTIDIDLKLDGKQMRAEFLSANADVRQMLESQMPRLRDMLQAQGMQLTDASVGQHKDGPGSNTAERDDRDPASATAWANGDAVDGEDAVTLSRGVLRQRDGLLDEYA